jgi:hypothetical protein
VLKAHVRHHYTLAHLWVWLLTLPFNRSFLGRSDYA